MPAFEIETPGGTFEVEAPDQAKALDALRSYEQSSNGHTGFILPLHRDRQGDLSLATPRLLSDIWTGAKDAMTLPGDVARGRYNLPLLDQPGVREDDAGNVYQHGRLVGNRILNERSYLERVFGAAGMAVGGGVASTATRGPRYALDPSVLRSGGGGRRIPFHQRSTSAPKEFASEIASVLETGVSSRGKLFREDLGEITIDMGYVGNPAKEYKGGWGLSHILEKRTHVDKIDGDKFVRETLPTLLSDGRLTKIVGLGHGRRALIEHGDYKAHLSMYRDGKRESWIITGFGKRSSPGASQE